MEVALDEVLKKGMVAEPCICYTGDILDETKEKYNLKYYINMAKELEKRGAHILGIKDMTGLLKPMAAKKLIESLKQELSRLQGSLGSVKASAAADEQIISLMTQTNKNLLRLESASSSKEISAIESELISAANSLNKMPASGAKKELLENFSGTLLRTLKKRGGVLGLGALALFSAGVIVVSQDKPAAEISHDRLNIQRVFKETYETRPELFSAQMFILAEEHGTDLVASVLYENQKYLPLLEAQLSIMSSTKLIQTLSIFKGSNSPEQTKELLLESLSAAS